MSLETVIGTRDGCWKIDSCTQKVLIFPTKNRSKPQNILSGKCSLIFPLFYRLCSPYKTVIYQSASKQSIEENGNRHLNYSSHKAGQHHFQITVFQFAEFAFSGEKKKSLRLPADSRHRLVLYKGQAQRASHLPMCGRDRNRTWISNILVLCFNKIVLPPFSQCRVNMWRRRGQFRQIVSSVTLEWSYPSTQLKSLQTPTPTSAGNLGNTPFSF